MIFVLSGSRRETARWAESQGIPLRQARHVYDAQTLPGRIAGVRFVQLPGFETRRDRHAVVARLKRANYRHIEVERWIEHQDEFGGWERHPGDVESGLVEPTAAPAEMPGGDIVLKALEMGADFVDTTDDEPQDDTPTAEPVPAEQEAPEADSDVDPFETMLGLTEKAVEDEDAGEVTSEVTIEAPEVEEEPVKAHEVVEVVQPVEAEQAKPKRTRRTKEQMAYDAALADWEGNGGSLEAVIEARDALANRHPDDERLLTAPRSDEENEAAAEDDDALDF